MEKRAHPDVKKFKEFVKQHPKLISEVRQGEKTWQEFFEDWYLFGDDDEMWDEYKGRNSNDSSEDNNETKPEILGTFLSSLKNMDLNQVEQHLNTFGEAITTLQSVLQQFQPELKQQQVTSDLTPFSFRKD
ncbi:YlbD family protein [Cytobacillus sp. IB215665]|uniref:YlbD family protein n=1 Tax=Cytobacillus sp. IB215665 TaxID=3097357 RepID=UPI002A123F01|nr:YlbD family protein [Cytobacillus sp. IB215665]MDX8364940.1 YlbD family protein [Cytobacillus sp. IB215665]